MNIIVVASSFPRGVDDAAGRFVLDLSRGLADRGHRIIHVVPQESGGNTPTTICGMKVIAVPIGRGNWGGGLAYGMGIGANLKRHPWLLTAVPSLLSALRRGIHQARQELDNPAILSHWVFPSGVVAARLARSHSMRHVSVAHGGGLQALLRSGIFTPFLKTWGEGTDAALFVSDDLRVKAETRLAASMPRDWRIQPMGIDSTRFAETSTSRNWRQELGLPAKGLFLLGVGRLIPLKGFDLLLQAASRIEHAQVVLAGVGPAENDLRRLATTLDVSCQFVGQLLPLSLGELYREADILVIPSRLGRGERSEGTPMVALEAMSQGLPFVASRTGGLSALALESKAGALFDVDDCLDLAQTLCKLAMDQPLRMSMKKEGLQFARLHEYSRTAEVVETMLLGMS